MLSIEKKGDIAIAWLDQEGDDVNKISPDLMDNFTTGFESLKNDSSIKGVVVISRKKDFIVGADIEWFTTVSSVEEIRPVIEKGHVLLDSIESFPKPVVAAIHGACMGAGLEIAMACHSRVVAKDANTTLALPEVRLGLLPGLGGTQRLPRLIGLKDSMDLMLTGKNLYPAKAYRLGLADVLTEKDHLLNAAIVQVENIIKGKVKKRKSSKPLPEKLLESISPGRNFMYKKATEMVQRQTLGNYPAPFKILDCIKTGLEKGFKAGQKAEIEHFSHLITTNESKQLVNLFFGMTALKKNDMKDQARKIQNIWMVGGGFMGAGITEISIPKGYFVTVKDIKQETLSKLKKDLWGTLQKGVKRKQISTSEAERRFNKLSVMTSLEGVEHADIVIEAVFEDLKLKQKILADFESVTPEHCIFATNTSALPVSRIAEHSKRKDRVIGLHYFSPVPKMPLLEIVVTPETADWVRATGIELGVKQGKVCIVVNDGPGFYTTRILAPYFNEALLIIEEGAAIPDIDKAMKKFGYPVGPVTLLDEVGLDVGAHVMGGELIEHYKQRPGAKASDLVKKLYDAGFHGRKNKKGFYSYDSKTGKKVRGKVHPEIYQFIGGERRKSFDEGEIQERMAMVMVKEALMCLEDKIISNPRDGDIGAVFGLGFPPFRGGPFRYLDQLGNENALKLFDKLTEKHGDRFQAPEILKTKVKQGDEWYSKAKASVG